MYISEEVEVIFTRGAAVSSKDSSIRDVVDPKYFMEIDSASGESLVPRRMVRPRENPWTRELSQERSQVAAVPVGIAPQMGPPVSTSKVTYVSKEKQRIEGQIGAYGIFGPKTAVAPCKSPPASMPAPSPSAPRGTIVVTAPPPQADAVPYKAPPTTSQIAVPYHHRTLPNKGKR